MISPFLEQGAVYNQLDFGKRMMEPPNRALVSILPAVASCPSSPKPDHLRFVCPADEFVFDDPGVASTNYVACSGSFNRGFYFFEPEGRRNGVFYEDSCTRFNDITDGSSNTFLVGETKFCGDGTNRLMADGGFIWAPVWYGTLPNGHGRSGPVAIRR